MQSIWLICKINNFISLCPCHIWYVWVTFFFFMVPIFEYLMPHYFVVILTATDFHNVITQQDMPSRRLQYVFETCLQDVFKTCLYFVDDLWRAAFETPVPLFKNTFFCRTSPVAAASESFRFPACSFIKKETRGKMFICEFCKIFKNIFLSEHLRMTASYVYLWIFSEVYLWSFSNHLFYRAYMGNCLFHLQVAEFQLPHTVNKYFTWRVLFRNFIQEEVGVAIRRRSCI